MSSELTKALRTRDSKLNAPKNEGNTSEQSLSNVEKPTYGKNLIEWRRNKTLELYSRGNNMHEISTILHVSVGTVSEDLRKIFSEAIEAQKDTISQLFKETQRSLKALDMMLVVLWQSLEHTQDIAERLAITSQLSAIINQRLEIVAGKHSITKKTLRTMHSV